jgi:uncharacterized repeat protein (TIGR03987 family)
VRPILLLAIVLMTFALASYTTGVWAQRRSGQLRWWQVGAFAAGLTADVSGTVLMAQLAAPGAPVVKTATAAMLDSVMKITGGIALVLMLVLLVWSIVVMVRSTPRKHELFRRYGVVIWAIWLVPYFSGLIAAMV